MPCPSGRCCRWAAAPPTRCCTACSARENEAASRGGVGACTAAVAGGANVEAAGRGSPIHWGPRAETAAAAAGAVGPRLEGVKGAAADSAAAATAGVAALVAGDAWRWGCGPVAAGVWRGGTMSSGAMACRVALGSFCAASSSWVAPTPACCDEAEPDEGGTAPATGSTGTNVEPARGMARAVRAGGRVAKAGTAGRRAAPAPGTAAKSDAWGGVVTCGSMTCS